MVDRHRPPNDDAVVVVHSRRDDNNAEAGACNIPDDIPVAVVRNVPVVDSDRRVVGPYRSPYSVDIPREYRDRRPSVGEVGVDNTDDTNDDVLAAWDIPVEVVAMLPPPLRHCVDPRLPVARPRPQRYRYYCYYYYCCCYCSRHHHHHGCRCHYHLYDSDPPRSLVRPKCWDHFPLHHPVVHVVVGMWRRFHHPPRRRPPPHHPPYCRP